VKTARPSVARWMASSGSVRDVQKSHTERAVCLPTPARYRARLLRFVRYVSKKQEVCDEGKCGQKPDLGCLWFNSPIGSDFLDLASDSCGEVRKMLELFLGLLVAVLLLKFVGWILKDEKKKEEETYRR